MTRKECLSRLTDELHYDEERLRVVAELLNASPEMSENDFDRAWVNSKLAWRIWRAAVGRSRAFTPRYDKTSDLGAINSMLSAGPEQATDVLILPCV